MKNYFLGIYKRTTPISNIDELKFSKKYITSFGVNVYLQQKIKVSGSVAFNYNEEYKTMCLKLDENSISVVDNLNKNLEILGLPCVKMTTHETYGNQIYIKVKKNQECTKAERGHIMNGLDLTLSFFTNKRNEVFTSLSV